MNKFFNTILLTVGACVLVSCGDNGTKDVSPKSDRSVQYFPNMYQSVGYETYQEGTVFENNMEAQKPVDGTVSRGWLPYDYEDDNDGYASAKANLENPVPLTEAHFENGKALYDIYCAICHGANGNGQGHLVKTEKILGVPSYDSREITAGSIYHVMYYGINYMGSYASQTSIEERWEITHYVEALRADLMGVPRKPLIDAQNVDTPVDDLVLGDDAPADAATAEPVENMENTNQDNGNSNNGQ